MTGLRRRPDRALTPVDEPHGGIEELGGRIEGPDKGNRVLGIADEKEATGWMEGREGKKTELDVVFGRLTASGSKGSAVADEFHRILSLSTL